MLRFRDISLERKLKCITVLATVVALLIASIGLLIYDAFSFRRAMVRSLNTLAEVTAQNCALPLSISFQKEAGDFLKTFEAEPRILAARVFDRSGKEFARYQRTDLKGDLPPMRSPGHRFTERGLEVFRPIRAEGEIIGTVYLESDLVELRERSSAYAGVVGMVLAVALAVALLLASRLQRVISGPLLKLANAAGAVSREKNYSLRVEKHGNDELGTLIEGFNQMLAQIQERDTQLQSAHDLLEARVRERTRELQGEIAERKQAEAVVQQQLARISLLNQITHAISERQDVQSILSVVLHRLEQHLAIRFGAFYLFDVEYEVFELGSLRIAGNDDAEQLFVTAFQSSQLRLGALRACAEQQTVYVPDAASLQVEVIAHNSSEVRSLVGVPLVVEKNLFGLLVAGRSDVDAFTSGECEFLKMLCEQVALAGHQARLYAELQAAYDELRETQAAAMQHERLRALGQLASGIAHDINNALSPVTGYAELLQMTEKNLTSPGSKYLQHILTAGEDIKHIVSRLREFYRRREESDEFKPLRLNDIAAQVVDLTRPRWKDVSQQRGVAISVNTDLAEPLPLVLGIESEVREALTNLFFNAIDAMSMSGGGNIIIRTRLLRGRDDLRAGPGELSLEVQDDGVGMDEETRRRCLEPFFSTKGARGTGLGLAMVYGIMERHEGRIDVESAVGKGTTMRLVFPLRAIPNAKAEKQLAPPAPLPSMRVLFVDDEPLLRQLVRSLLENDQHVVVTAENGEQALAKFQEAMRVGDGFDVVITDLGMPHMDGRKLARLIKADCPHMPIIMLTGWGTLMRAEEDKPREVDRILSKPPRIHDLREALRTSVAREAPVALA